MSDTPAPTPAPSPSHAAQVDTPSGAASSDAPSATDAAPKLRPWEPALIWTLRILIGATFVMSGFVKMIDPWGFIFKIEEYLAIWHMTQPRTIVLMMALAVSGYEFVLGSLMVMGCYKRSSAWGLTLMMAVMLPLTAYLWIADPVSDCGCFGDFITLSNGATFLKNILITAGLIYLSVRSSRLKMAMFNPAIQWVVGAWLTLYILLIGLYGYNIQPMLDFRPFPVGGAPVASAESSGESDEDFSFIYERDGERRTFTIDDLPDSTWTFVDRVPSVAGREASATPSAAASAPGSLTLFDGEGEEATAEAITGEGTEILLVIPELRRADISYTYTVNEMYEYADSVGIPMVALLGTDTSGIERWKDAAMAEYPCYTADDTQLKELARGTMAVVVLRDGVPVSKTTVGSLDPAAIESPASPQTFLDSLSDNGRSVLMWLDIVFGGVLLLLYLFQGIILAVRTKIMKKYRAKHRKNA